MIYGILLGIGTIIGMVLVVIILNIVTAKVVGGHMW